MACARCASMSAPISPAPDLFDLLDRVMDEATFLAFVEALIADRHADAAGAPDVAGRGPHGWENHSIEAFLSAALAWARDSDFGQRQDLAEASPWKRFATFLYCGKIYE
ncbi:Hypothetical protein A7982_11669 [Minicystis rosea]|nr:Hypothetical protein A7982_11669 [Minicystis rosea]